MTTLKNGTQEKLRDTLPWKAGSLVFTKKTDLETGEL